MKDDAQHGDRKDVKNEDLKTENVDPEDALRAFMQVDPKKVKKAEKKAALRKVRKRRGGE